MRIITIATFFLLGLHCVCAQTPRQPQPPSPSAIPNPVPASTIASQIDQLEKSLEDLKSQFSAFRNNALKDEMKGLEDRLNTFIAAVAVFLALFGLGPIIIGMSAERRAREAHSLAIRGETAAQGRADEVHQASKNTLDLVNQTLELAKDASERAATIIQKRAIKLRDELNSEAKVMLTEASTKDERFLISNSERRSDLTTLANKINNFEINSFTFPEELELNADCQFIRGMDFHVKQQFKDALRVWYNVALDDSASSDRRSLAWYWIGYEQNNLGDFDKAEESFRNAEKFAAGDRLYELRRIRLESRFFNKKIASAESILPELAALSDELDNPHQMSAEILKQRDKVYTTYANVLFEAGHVETDPQKKEAHYRLAKEKFEAIVNRKIGDIKWARFGLGQILFVTGFTEEAAKILAGPARKDAQDEYIARVEPRTKVLARSTELICCTLVATLKHEVRSVHGDLIGALGNVDDRLTVYSQFQKRNVSKDDFKLDLDGFLKQHDVKI